MDQRHLTVVINFPQILAVDLLSCPNLAYLLKKAVVRNFAAKNFNAVLSHLFKYQQPSNLPTAAIEALTFNLPADIGWWLRVEPIQIQVEHKGIYLLGNVGSLLSAHEVDELATELNEFLKLEKFYLYTPTAQHWYLQTHDDPEIMTYPLGELIGKELSPYLPVGPRAKFWRKLLTELQMLVYGSHVNQQRQSKDLPLLGGVWLAGEGRLPQLPPANWQAVYSNHALGVGLAKLSDIKTIAKIDDFSTAEILERPGDYLLILEQTHPNLQEWEEIWFKPMLQALKTKKIDRITLNPSNGRTYQITRKSLWAWWRKTLPK